jgi:integrase
VSRVFSKITRSKVRALPRGESVTENGMSFKRLADGDGLFSINVMVDGKRIHRNIGRESDGTTRTTAEEFLAKVRSEARERRLKLPKRRKVALTVAAATPLYLESLRQEGGKDIERKGQKLNVHIIPFLGDRPVSEITTSDIDRYKKHRLSQHISGRADGSSNLRNTRPATVNRELAVLSHLVNKAVEWGWIDRPSVKIRKLKEDNGRIVYLSATQAERLLEAAAADQNPQIFAFILIGLRTGMRKSEILSIRREHIDLDARTIFVPSAKSGPRTQPISADLISFIAGYAASLPEETPWLFPSHDARQGHTVDVRKAFVRSVKCAGLDPNQVVRHTLRHTAITHLVQAGVDLPTVKRISGHKTMAMVERYAHQSGAHIDEAMDRLDDRYRTAKNTT